MKRILLIVTMVPMFLLALEFDEARFLLSRSGLGASLQEIENLKPLKYDQAIRQLIEQSDNKAQTPYPQWYGTSLPKMRNYKELSAKEKQALRKLRRQRWRQLQLWWINEMSVTTSPITEKMTLFWHNHFTSQLPKVKWPSLMLRQNILLRREALGNFATLLKEISKDPAMLIYLDNISNKKSHPNENFARELLELFTLGEGHYSESDIKAAAKAFSGWTVDRKNGNFKFDPKVHDFGEKTFLGKTGRFNGNDIIDIILEQNRTAEFITEKFYREFISYEIDETQVRQIAATFRKSGYKIKVLLYELLTSNAFVNSTNRTFLIKSPIELVVGTVRTFNLQTNLGKYLFKATRAMGQEIFNPPNVKGWSGEKSWITTGSLAERRSFLKKAAKAVNKTYQNSTGFTTKELEKWLLVTDRLTQTAVTKKLFSSILLDPLYNLK